MTTEFDETRAFLDALEEQRLLRRFAPAPGIVISDEPPTDTDVLWADTSVEGIDSVIIVHSTKGDNGGTLSEKTPLDLTKTINKLSAGYYTLANGAEGQLMYLVPQNGSNVDGIYIEISRARILTDNINSIVQEDDLFLPFKPSFATNLNNLVVLIFTDGAWNLSNGTLD